VATKGRPFTVRLRPEVERRLEEEARRAQRPKTVMLEALADEALRMRRYPGIGFRGAEHDRRAWVMGTGLNDFGAMISGIQRTLRDLSQES
jgi:hypothetical protein